jgi:transcriptional regulator with XRE-family HTH domain
MSDFLSLNLKHLRKAKSLTQEEFANKIGVKRSIIGSYEEGRAEPKLSTIQTIAYYFQLTVDDLINVDLSKEHKKSKGNETSKDIEGWGLRILPIIVDRNEDTEFITLVPVKAAAGYLNGYSDPEFVEELPTFRLPFTEVLNKGTIRAFQIKGDSMLPVPPNSYVIGEYVQDWKQIKDGHCYIFITKDDGIVYKRAYNKINETEEVLLKSDNCEYDPYAVKINDIIEIWKALGYISFELPSPEIENLSLQKLSAVVTQLKKDLEGLKK